LPRSTGVRNVLLSSASETANISAAPSPCTARAAIRNSIEPAAAAAAERFAATLGLHVAWVGDAPGLVLARIVACLVNEACFAIAEGVGDADAIDRGMVLGLNHPRGPLAWGELMGLEHVARVVDGLAESTGTDRYGLAPHLARMLHEEE